MPDLNLDVNFRDHPKTRRLVAMLGKDSEWMVVKLWLYVARIHPEGDISDYTGQEIEALVDWGGTPGAFVEAMEKVEMLSKNSKNKFKLLGWKDHQGHLVAYKVRGEKAAKARWSKALGRCHKHTTSIPQALLNSTPSNAPTDGADGADVTNGANVTDTKLAATAEPSPASQKDLSQDDWLKMLSADPAYEGLDVPIQFARMVQWCKTNGKQPTRRRFINWLNRADKPMKTAATETDHSKGF